MDAQNTEQSHEDFLAQLARIERRNAETLAALGIPQKITRQQVIEVCELLGFDANQVYYLSLNDGGNSVSVGLADVGTKFPPGLLQTGLLRPFTAIDIEITQDDDPPEESPPIAEPRPDIEPASEES